MAEALTTENFDDKIKNGKVVVDFWAPWCGPCKQMLPHFEEAAEEDTGAALVTLNVDEHPDIAGKLRIRGVPTVIFFREGEEIHRFSGAKEKDAIVEEVKNAYQ